MPLIKVNIMIDKRTGHRMGAKECLYCGRMFVSWDVRKNWICLRCAESHSFQYKAKLVGFCPDLLYHDLALEDAVERIRQSSSIVDVSENPGEMPTGKDLKR